MLRIRLALAIGLVAYASTITMAATLRVVDYGARCDGSTNDWAAIQAAINAANAGDLIEFPAGWCAFSGNIFISSRSNLELYGAGMPNTFLLALDWTHSALRIENSNSITVRDLQINSPYTTARTSDTNATGFYILHGSGINFSRVKVYYTGGAGIQFEGVSYGGVYDSEVIQTWADGIHATGGSYSITIQNNYADGTGDDSFSCIGYGQTINQYVGFYSNRSLNSQASGVTIEGCQNVEAHNNYIYRSQVAGIRAASDPAWPTGMVNEADIQWNNLVEVSQNQSIRHPAIYVYTNYADVRNVHVLNNTIQNPATTDRAVELYGGNGQSVHDSQVQNNTITGALAQCTRLGGSTYNISVSGNTLNGAACY
jgi:polygalacturonase